MHDKARLLKNNKYLKKKDSDVDMVDEVKTCTSVSFGSFYLSTKTLIVFHSYKERVVKQGTVVIVIQYCHSKLKKYNFQNKKGATLLVAVCFSSLRVELHSWAQYIRL